MDHPPGPPCPPAPDVDDGQDEAGWVASAAAAEALLREGGREAASAATDDATPDRPSTPTVDEHLLGVTTGHAHQERAQTYRSVAAHQAPRRRPR